MESYHGTTIVSVRRGNVVALGGDGQVTLGNIVVKATARKVRTLHHDKVLAGFAGAHRRRLHPVRALRGQAREAPGQPGALGDRAGQGLAHRPHAAPPRGDAAVADRETSLIITGNGDVLEPEYGIVAIGSGGVYAQAAARALLEHTELAPDEIVKRSLEIAGDLCIYTNQIHIIETLE